MIHAFSGWVVGWSPETVAACAWKFAAVSIHSPFDGNLGYLFNQSA
jgi:hypothetical protein